MSFESATDQMGRRVLLPRNPQRIISIVPSQTELLFDLGVGNRVVGITKFCTHPKEQTGLISKIGGTKQLDLAAIRALKPDLIVGNKEENAKEEVEALMPEFPVWMSDIVSLADAYEMIGDIGRIVDREIKARELVQRISFSFEELTSLTHSFTCKKVAYLIWRNPYMLAGKETFIDQMLGLIRLESISSEERYPVITAEELAHANPEVILLSTEPYPFKEKHIAELNRVCPEAEVLLVDGEMFCWPGSRLQYSGEYLTALAVRWLSV